MIEVVIGQAVEAFKLCTQNLDANLGIRLDYELETMFIIDSAGIRDKKELLIPEAPGYTKDQIQEVMGKITRKLNDPDYIRYESRLGDYIISVNDPTQFEKVTPAPANPEPK